IAGSQGGYFAVVSNFAGTVTSATATLSFDSSALSILASPKDTTVQAGFTASLTVVASGIPPLVYQWEHDGAASSGATRSSPTRGGLEWPFAGSHPLSGPLPGLADGACPRSLLPLESQPARLFSERIEVSSKEPRLRGCPRGGASHNYARGFAI